MLKKLRNSLFGYTSGNIRHHAFQVLEKYGQTLDIQRSDRKHAVVCVFAEGRLSVQRAIYEDSSYKLTIRWSGRKVYEDENYNSPTIYISDTLWIRYLLGINV